MGQALLKGASSRADEPVDGISLREAGDRLALVLLSLARRST
jgi:hypothetical protein